MIIVMDIDGCLADCSHRLHYLKEKDYDKFYSEEEILKDTPIRAGEDLLYELFGHNNIILVTGRPYRTENTTRIWLSRLNSQYADLEMYMRKDHDYRPSSVVKVEILNKLGIKDIEGSSVFFIDDDPENVKAVQETFPNAQGLLFARKFS